MLVVWRVVPDVVEVRRRSRVSAWHEFRSVLADPQRYADWVVGAANRIIRNDPHACQKLAHQLPS